MPNLHYNILAIALGALTVAPSPAAMLVFEPAATQLAAGASTNIHINVIDAVDLYAFQFGVTFDPLILSIDSVTAGGFLAGGLVFPGAIDPVSGAVQLTFGTLLGAPPGVSGTGTLAILRVTGRQLGHTTVTLTDILLLDSSAQEIPVSFDPVAITVVPEPGTALLLALALAGVARGRSIRAT
ncbi:MAG: cohesin domain-containing protein [Acidobacteria bacterium]|nr:cohesin domain-containing protein [Acidobacteriota bacterium]